MRRGLRLRYARRGSSSAAANMALIVRVTAGGPRRLRGELTGGLSTPLPPNELD